MIFATDPTPLPQDKRRMLRGVMGSVFQHLDNEIQKAEQAESIQNWQLLKRQRDILLTALKDGVEIPEEQTADGDDIGPRPVSAFKQVEEKAIVQLGGLRQLWKLALMHDTTVHGFRIL